MTMQDGRFCFVRVHVSSLTDHNDVHFVDHHHVSLWEEEGVGNGEFNSASVHFETPFVYIIHS